MKKTILLKRGLKKDLPTLLIGELGFCTDTDELFIGSEKGNLLINRGQDLLIAPSEVNGSLLINGEETKVYDDTMILESLSSKLTADSLLNYVKSDSLEKHLLEKLDSDRFEVFMLDFQQQVAQKAERNHQHDIFEITDLKNILDTKANKHESTELDTSQFVIDLERWGITNGLPSKPYQASDYELADQNIRGLNQALNHAVELNVTNVFLPKGEYALCYPREIKMLSHITLHLNGSILKVIYDSDHQSPFDTRNSNDYFNFIGNSISFENVTNAHLIGGTIIGCRDDRSFSSPNERRQEHTYGVIITKGSNHCSVKNCVVRDYMGDNISIRSDSPQTLAEFNLNLSLQTVDQRGALIPSENALTSGFIDIPNQEYTSFLIAGFGYARHTSLIRKEVHVHFYNENNEYLRSLRNRKIYTPITIPLTARKLRIEFLNETNPSKNMNITIRWGLFPNFNTIEHNEIYNGHRGGITSGGSYNMIQHNIIRDNGYNFLDGKPLFSDSTRYGINQEDSYGDHCVIRNNLIYNSNHGILVGCYSIEIENNHIYQVDSIAINIYSTSFAKISGNYLYRCQNTVGLMTANLPESHIYMERNYLYGGTTQLVGSGYDIKVLDNTFVDPSNISLFDSPKAVFKNNHIQYTSYYNGNGQITANMMEGCIFEAKGPRREITFYSYEFFRCQFDNITIQSRTRNDRTQVESVAFTHCRFQLSQIKNHVFNTKKRMLTINESTIIDTDLYIGNINTQYENPLIRIINSDFMIKSINHLIHTEINNTLGNGMISVEDSKIDIRNSTFQYLISSNFTVVSSVLSMILKDSDVIYSSSDGRPLQLLFYRNKKSVKEFISSNNQWKNISLPQKEEDNIMKYDPKTHDSEEPAKGYYSKGDIVYNAFPEPGGYVGWVCVQAGIANNEPWQPNTSYERNELIHSSNQVYQSQLTGISSQSAQKNWGESAVDGTVVWKLLGEKAIFKPFGLIEK
ncbi:hypothetical protein BTS2_3918 [Bacillus sp. TS-2]|nr:hypothetical protein BTS2_3918 [Bacillus sp. TS-2]